MAGLTITTKPGDTRRVCRESLPPELILNPPPKRARRRPEVGFRYGDRTVRWHDPAAIVIRQEGGPPRFLVRDLSSEKRLTGEFIEAHFPRIFTERNYREVEGSDAPTSGNVRGAEPERSATEPMRPMVPTATVSLGSDGVKVDLGFRSDHYPVPPGRVLDAWAGRRDTIRRLDGHLMELPTQWLERHGEFLADYLALNVNIGSHAVHRTADDSGNFQPRQVQNLGGPRRVPSTD